MPEPTSLIDWRTIMDCETILNHYPDYCQRNQAVQELSECILELTKRPDQIKEDHAERVRDEIADSLIMLVQMHLLYDGKQNLDKLKDQIRNKLNRQMERIANERTL